MNGESGENALLVLTGGLWLQKSNPNLRIVRGMRLNCRRPTSLLALDGDADFEGVGGESGRSGEDEPVKCDVGGRVLAAGTYNAELCVWRRVSLDGPNRFISLHA
jgi:hypothetical protein